MSWLRLTARSNFFPHLNKINTKCLTTFICCPWAYSSSHKQLHLPYFAHILGFWVTCGVKMMSLHHGWGWQPPQTASHIHIRSIQSVWAHWCAVHGHRTLASISYTHLTWVIFWGTGSLVESRWGHNVIVEGESHLRLLPASTLDLYKVFELIDMLSLGIKQQPFTFIPTLLGSDFGVLGHLCLWSQNDGIMSLLRVTATSNCLLHPH